MPFINTNLAIHCGVSVGTFFFAMPRATRAISHVEPSTKDVPTGGRNAAAKIISRTRAAPSLVTTPGSIMPPIEWPTMTISFQPGAFDIAGKRLDIVGDSHLPQVAGLVPPSRHVEDKHGQVRCQPMDLFDDEAPRIGGHSASVHEDQRGQSHGGLLWRRTPKTAS